MTSAPSTQPASRTADRREGRSAAGLHGGLAPERRSTTSLSQPTVGARPGSRVSPRHPLGRLHGHRSPPGPSRGSGTRRQCRSQERGGGLVPSQSQSPTRAMSPGSPRDHRADPAVIVAPSTTGIGAPIAVDVGTTGAVVGHPAASRLGPGGRVASAPDLGPTPRRRQSRLGERYAAPPMAHRRPSPGPGGRRLATRAGTRPAPARLGSLAGGRRPQPGLAPLGARLAASHRPRMDERIAGIGQGRARATPRTGRPDRRVCPLPVPSTSRSAAPESFGRRPSMRYQRHRRGRPCPRDPVAPPAHVYGVVGGDRSGGPPGGGDRAVAPAGGVCMGCSLGRPGGATRVDGTGPRGWWRLGARTSFAARSAGGGAHVASDGGSGQPGVRTSAIGRGPSGPATDDGPGGQVGRAGAQRRRPPLVLGLVAGERPDAVEGVGLRPAAPPAVGPGDRQGTPPARLAPPGPGVGAGRRARDGRQHGIGHGPGRRAAVGTDRSPAR